MIIGAHVMVQSNNKEADKAFFRDILQFPNVDAGNGFLLFAAPATEIAIHEGSSETHELFLMCEDVDEFIADMRGRDVFCSPAQNRGWGIITHMTLPGGGRLSVYEPLHARPETPAKSKRGSSRRRTKSKGRKTAARKTAGRTARKKATQRRGRARKTR